MNILHFDLPRVAHIAPEVRAAPRSDGWSNTGETAAERLQELEDEWSIEGIFEAAAAIVGLATFAVGLAFDDRWLVLPLLVSILLLQQTLQGWCPVLPLMRGLGFRTEREIQFERHMLLEIEAGHAACHSMAARPASAAAPARQNHHLRTRPADAPASPFSLRDFLVSSAS